MATNKEEAQKLQRIMIENEAIRWFDSIIGNYESGIREIQRYKNKFERAIKNFDEFSKPEDIISWTVNEVNNTARNMRLDMAVNHAARLAVTRPQDNDQKNVK